MSVMNKAYIEAKEEGLINPEDAEFFEEFIGKYATLRKLSKSSRYKYELVAKTFLPMLKDEGRSLRTLDEKTVLKFIAWLQEESPWAEDTRQSYWDRFARIYEHVANKYNFKDSDAYPILAGTKKEKYRYSIDNNKVKKKGTLTPEEVLKLINLEHELCYKTYFAILYESGMRADEIASVNLENVERHENGDYTLHMQRSKTIIRPIPILEFGVQYLNKWLLLHPHKDEPKSPLFLNATGRPLTPAMANKRLRKLMRLSNIKNMKISLHSFRHSRASELANFMNEFQMCKFFGWSMGSDMPRTYIREKNIDVRRCIKAARGEVEEEKRKPSGKICLSCEHQNALDAEYCDNCNLPLDRRRFENLKKNLDSERLLRSLVEEKWGQLIGDMRVALKKRPKATPAPKT